MFYAAWSRRDVRPRDPETHRPRINKPGSVIDREQRARGRFYDTT